MKLAVGFLIEGSFSRQHALFPSWIKYYCKVFWIEVRGLFWSLLVGTALPTWRRALEPHGRSRGSRNSVAEAEAEDRITVLA
jgi:hypothetical protein